MKTLEHAQMVDGWPCFGFDRIEAGQVVESVIFTRRGPEAVHVTGVAFGVAAVFVTRAEGDRCRLPLSAVFPEGTDARERAVDRFGSAIDRGLRLPWSTGEVSPQFGDRSRFGRE